MTGNDFLKRLKAYGKATGQDVSFDEKRGKGSHGTAYLGSKFTIVKDRKKELPPGLLRSMLRDLDIDPTTF